MILLHVQTRFWKVHFLFTKNNICVHFFCPKQTSAAKCVSEFYASELQYVGAPTDKGPLQTRGNYRKRTPTDKGPYRRCASPTDKEPYMIFRQGAPTGKGLLTGKGDNISITAPLYFHKIFFSRENMPPYLLNRCQFLTFIAQPFLVSKLLGEHTLTFFTLFSGVNTPYTPK